MYEDTCDKAEIEWEQEGAYLILRCEALDVRVRLEDPEQLYDAVKGGIGPWLRERDEALRTLPVASYDPREAYDPSDPKHPDWHSVHADIYDNREKC